MTLPLCEKTIIPSGITYAALDAAAWHPDLLAEAGQLRTDSAERAKLVSSGFVPPFYKMSICPSSSSWKENLWGLSREPSGSLQQG